MQKYLATFKQMISLRGLTDHTFKSYSTYIRAYLDYSENILHKKTEDVSWQELRILPYQLNLEPLFMPTNPTLYALMHKCTSKTLLELSVDKKYLGATPDIIQVLHIWGQEMNFYLGCLAAYDFIQKAKEKVLLFTVQ